MFTIERQGYSELIPMVLKIVDDLREDGKFAVKFPLDTNGQYEAPSTSAFKIILETTGASNIISAQPWRICFEIMDSSGPAQGDYTVSEPQLLAVYVGTDTQLTDTGFISKSLYRRDGGATYWNEPRGNIGAEWTFSDDSDKFPTIASTGHTFYNRWPIGDLQAGRGYPMTYRMSITDRGLFLGIWRADSQETGKDFHWLVIQRSVDKDTGVVRGTTIETTDSKCPVFCINSTDNKYYKFIAREVDVLAPSSRFSIADDIDDHPSVMNTLKQVSFNEDGNYVITLLNNLTTPRYKYTDELDMVGTISADVVGAGQEIDVSVYGENSPRTYRALYANGPNNTGMRLMVLVANPN